MKHVSHVEDFHFEFVPVAHFENFVEPKIEKLEPIFLRVLFVLLGDIVSDKQHLYRSILKLQTPKKPGCIFNDKFCNMKETYE